MLSFQGSLTVAAYAACKHALAGLTKALANECPPHGVEVLVVDGGWTGR